MKSAKEFRDSLVQKKIPLRETLQKYVNQAEAKNKTIGAYIAFSKDVENRITVLEELLAANKASQYPLFGVPIALKDNLCTEGLRTTAGSKILNNFIPPYTATLVRRLEEAGALIVGKANMDEFAMGSSTETSAYGVTRNPWNPEYVPGGSSGGSAAAVAGDLAMAAIGTDTGGSIRQPASFCGIVGLKPTYGRVSRYGIVAFASSLDQAGPLTLNVEDAALMLEVISGHDVRDATSSQRKVPSWQKSISQDLKGVRVGLPREYFGEGVDPEVQKCVQAGLGALKDAGAITVEVDLPLTWASISTYYLVATSEASSNLARFDGIRYGFRAPAGDLEELYRKSRGEGFGSEVKRRIMLGTYALSSGYYDAYYKKACQVRRLIQNDFDRAFQKCDLIAGPVATTPAFRLGERLQDPLKMYLNDIFTTSVNLAGLPGISVPAGFSQEKLPIGIQLIAPAFEEQRLFNAGFAIEKRLNLAVRPQ